MNRKVCTKCGEEKVELAFSYQSAAKDRLSSWCRDCCTRASQARYWEAKRAVIVKWKNRTGKVW